VQTFLGKVNFLRRFIPNFAEFLKVITSLLKKGSGIKWIEQPKKSFNDIKRALGQAPLLISPVFSKYFRIFCFTSKLSIFGVFLQKNEASQEYPISFFSRVLRDTELKYNIIDK